MSGSDHGERSNVGGEAVEDRELSDDQAAVAAAVPNRLPVFGPGQVIPRDLRPARELVAKGYPVPEAVAAWLATPAPQPGATPALVALYSTSEARRRRGDLWLRPGRPVAHDATLGPRPERSRQERRIPFAHTPIRSGTSRRPTVSGDPRSWLRDLFREGFVVIDTETTGLSARDEIIEIAAVASDGTVLFESKLWPHRGSVPAASTRIHGLRIEDLDGAPRWPDILDDLYAALAGHRVLAWNAPFDERLSVQSSRAWGVPHPLPAFECAMRAYSYGRGVGSGSFKLGRAATVEGVLVAAQSHRSADDARLTLAVLKSLHRKAGSPA